MLNAKATQEFIPIKEVRDGIVVLKNGELRAIVLANSVNLSLKSADDWVLSETRIKRGAALGANSTIRCGITIGPWAMIGAGSVVTQDVPDYGLAYGNPARLHGFVCPCGEKLHKESIQKEYVILKCPKCGEIIQIPIKTWENIT